MLLPLQLNLAPPPPDVSGTTNLLDTTVGFSWSQATIGGGLDDCIYFLPNAIYNLVSADAGTSTYVLTKPTGARLVLLLPQTAATNYYIKPGDYLPRSFANTAVNTTTDVITLASHGFTSGDGPYKMTSTLTLPEPFATSPNLLAYVRVLTSSTFTLHTSRRGASHPGIGTMDLINLTTQGTGTHSLPNAIVNHLTDSDGYAPIRMTTSDTEADGIVRSMYVAAPTKITVMIDQAGALLKYWWV